MKKSNLVIYKKSKKMIYKQLLSYSFYLNKTITLNKIRISLRYDQSYLNETLTKLHFSLDYPNSNYFIFFKDKNSIDLFINGSENFIKFLNKSNQYDYYSKYTNFIQINTRFYSYNHLLNVYKLNIEPLYRGEQLAQSNIIDNKIFLDKLILKDLILYNYKHIMLLLIYIEISLNQTK